LVVLMLLLAALPVQAQEVVIDGLANPRGITFDGEGNLYIVENGNAGDVMIEGRRAPMPTGSGGQVTRVTPEGDTAVIIRGLPNQGSEGQTRGASGILVTEDAIWLALGQTPDVYPFSMGLVELAPEILRIRNFVDFYSIELSENPDEDISESNPVDLVMADDGTIYVADASCNCIFSWSEDSGVAVMAAWEAFNESAVPTSVDIGPDGDLYIGFLGGFPYPEGSTRIERWSGGALAETYQGLTAVTDVLVADDGTLYAVEYGVYGDTGWGPGRVVRVTADGPETVLGDLNQPYALAMDADGTLYVTVNSASGGNTGMVLAIGM
jgi:hypothetical protein